MFKLVVLFALVAVAVAAPRPGFLAPLAVAHPVAIPAAVSHQSRVDIHSKPIIATTYAAAPVAVAAPVLAAPLAVAHAPAFIGHSAILAAPAHYGYAYGHGAYGLHPY